MTVDISQHIWRCPRCKTLVSKTVRFCPVCREKDGNKKSLKSHRRAIKALGIGAKKPKIEFRERKNYNRKARQERIKRMGRDTKVCWSCKKIKHIDEFASKGINRRGLLLLNADCRECERKKRWLKSTENLNNYNHGD